MMNNEDVYVVIFLKKDGSTRRMRCTKNLELIPSDKQPKSTTPKTYDNQTRVFDLDLKEWRSFLTDNVISSQIEQEYNQGEFNAG